MDSTPRVLGYLDRLGYRPGDAFTLHASSDGGTVDIDLVRLRRGPDPFERVPTDVVDVPWAGAGSTTVPAQTSCVGSFLVATTSVEATSVGGFTVGAWAWPTLTEADRAQTLFELSGQRGALVVSARGGVVTATLGGAAGVSVSADAMLANRAWTFVAVSVRGGELSLELTASDPLYSASGAAAVPLAGDVVFAAGSPLSFAARDTRDVVGLAGYARGRADDHYEGKLAYPFLSLGPLDGTSREALAGSIRGWGGTLWDLAPQRTGPARYFTPVLAGTGNPAMLVNLPNQGVTGPDWDATVVSFGERPDQYSAAHFHSTDLADCGWGAVHAGTLPDTLDSGVYGIRLTAADGSSDIVPFFVRPAPEGPRRRVLYVYPTFTYLAYGNEDLISFFATHSERFLQPGVLDKVRARQVYQSRELGASAYDLHPDGSGVHYSSALRPLLDMRVDYRFWAYETGTRSFPADMYLLQWLEQYGYDADVCTDLDVHHEGQSLLEHYDVVLTGSHPEYHSGAILDALTAYRDGGGKLCYLGGNGFYWVTGLINDEAGIIEIRRGHVGIRTWESEPGEVDLVSTFEPGGLWRFRGRAPQRLVGVGMGAQGGQSRPYQLATGAVRVDYDWFYRGIAGETIGEVGWVNGAAAGDELDRVDAKLGTPPGTVVLAASKEHPLEAQRAHEELLQMFHGSASGPNDPDVRADMTYFETPAGGAVFSASAIAFVASLLVDGGDNTSSRALQNVMDHFLGQG